MKTDWQNVHSKVQEKRKKVTFNTMQIIAFGFLGADCVSGRTVRIGFGRVCDRAGHCISGCTVYLVWKGSTAGADPDRRTGCHRMYEGGISGNSQEDHHEEQGYDPADIQSGDVERNGTVYYPDSEGNSSCRGHRSGVICVSFCS